MLRSATVRMALSYLGIIMLLSVVFSVAIYFVSERSVRAGLQRQVSTFQQSPSFRYFSPGYDLQQLYEDQLADAQGRLQLNLLLVNLGILIVAGAASYYLARLTLEPIEEALEAQSRFTADASHELRTPLTAMKSEIEVALRYRHLSASDARELLASNLEEISKLEALSNGLLRLARMESNKLEFSKTAIDDIVSEAVGRVSLVLSQRNIDLDTDLKDGKVMADPSLVEVFVILLDNAIKYSPVDSTIKLTSRSVGGNYYLSVIDEGVGIKASDLPHIFERFFRADNSRSKEKIDGYGLGLSIAQKIVLAHKGTIDVTSVPAKGTTFTVRLPLAPSLKNSESKRS